MFTVTAVAVFSDSQGDYPEEVVTLDLTKEPDLTLVQIVARVRNSSGGKYLTDQGMTLRTVTIEMEHI